MKNQNVNKKVKKKEQRVLSSNADIIRPIVIKTFAINLYDI